jgi:1-aminocyclopropane-1-carboxylate deaminase
MSSLKLICDYHFGGYAKVNGELKNFVSDFCNQTQIQLDLIYNGKMMYGLLDLIQKDYFPKKSKILAIHTGGVQGNSRFMYNK